MTNFALLNNVEHQNLRIITERSASYGDNVMQVMTFPFEFRNVQASYPILFQQNNSGSFHPVALFGFQQHENLFLDEQGWQAAYIPAMVRREPFLIGFQNPKEANAEQVRVLSLDLDHPRVSTDEGEALFHPLGGRTPFLEKTADLLETIYQGLDHSRAFIGALEEHELLEAVTLEIPLQDGSRNQLLGFHCLAEEKLQELSGEALGKFHKADFLMPIFMALASMSNFQRLIEMKNKSLNGEADHELAV